MKNIYSLRHLVAFFSFFYCFSGNLLAQVPSNPSPQAIPYKQNFDGLLPGATVYPAGFQGWQAGATQNTATYGTGLTGDKNLIGGSTANTNSGNIHNYNGKIGFLNTTSADFALGFAFSSLNNSAIIVQYDAMIIRNLYDGAAVNRLQEMALQYRVGIAGAFVTLTSTAYSNNSVTPQTGAVTTPLDNQMTRISVTLPSDCDNQPVVQIRWIARLASGTLGARQSFAIDNIEILSDKVAPISVVGYPKIDNILSDEFDFSNQLDEVGKTYYVLVSSTDSAPTSLQIKNGLSASGTAPLQSGILDITDKTKVYTKTITDLTLNTAYSVYSISEDPYGNIQASATKLDVTTSSVILPKLTPSKTIMNFVPVEQKFNSSSLSYQLRGTNLRGIVTVTASGNFAVSKDNADFQSSVQYDVADFDGNATPTVYVRFKPNTIGNFSGQIANQTADGRTKVVALSGVGIDPYIQDFNDADVLTNSGWTAYNVSGTNNKWVSTTTNPKSAPRAIVMNGYSDNGPSKDWLISPKLQLDTFDKFPLLSFHSRKYFPGPSLKLMVSTNYDGVSSPETATWIDLDGKFPTVTGSYVQSQYINLGDYKTNHTYLAWVYETTIGGGSGNASEWTIDDVAITNDLNFVDSNPNLDFGDVRPNSISDSKSFIFKAGGHGNITITAPTDYKVSLDNSNFQLSVNVLEADALIGKTVYTRFTPLTKELKIAGPLTISGTVLDKKIGTLTGSSLPKEDTFDIVTYNLKFFGTNVKDISGKEFGPTDNALQISNVAKVMIKLDADIYAVQEVSDDEAMDELIKQISVGGKTFSKVTSPRWSYSFNAVNPNFPAQKIVVIYNTKNITVKNTSVMFGELYDKVQAEPEPKNINIPNYPSPDGSGANFFSSGRLPYVVDIEANIGGVKREISIIGLHARANSGSDMSKYNMRKYDTKVLKDNLDANYPDASFIILGDFNDDVKKSVVGNNPSTYEIMVKDTDRYNALTLDISNAGVNSYYDFNPESFLDHIMISNELNSEYIANSTAVYDPRNDISNYINTTSDHGPVIARFELKGTTLGTIDFETKNGVAVKAYPNPATDVVNILVKTSDDKKLKLRLYDITGRMIGSPIDVTGGQDKNTSVIQVSDLKSGIYIYTLSDNNKVIFKDKIIKK